MAKALFAFLAMITIQYAYSAATSFRWCVLTAEKNKCIDFMNYVNKTAQNNSLEVAVGCVHGSSADDCVAKIKTNQADLVTLKAAYVYNAGKTDSLVPIVSEQYGKYTVKYYGVAVVKRAKEDLNIKTLTGKNSCHTGTRRNAGWNIPIGYLLRTGILPSVACGRDINDFLSAANFFGQSCVPGANAAEYNASGDIPGNLCTLCAGTGADKCSFDESKNRYAGHEGAFMCMAEDKGDVAFFKHGTVEKVLSKHANYGNLTDYVYLCKDGTRKDIGKHKTCNLGFNPAHAVVTRKGNADITKIITILTAMSDMYGVKQTDTSKFQLFNSTKYNGADLMFKDSSTALIAIAKGNQTYQAYLGDDYIKDTEALSSCDFQTTAQHPTQPPITAISAVATPYTVLVLFVALLTLLSL